jgi:hypothetical protein
MRKSGIKIWGGAIAIIGVLAAAGVLANNSFNIISGTNNTETKGDKNTSFRADNGGSITVTLPPSPVPYSLQPSPDPSSAPSPSQHSSPTAPVSRKLELECEQFGVPSYNYTKLISVANKGEEPKTRFLLYKGASRSVVCKILKNSGELNLAYGLPDNSSLSRAALKIYVDGSLRKKVDVSRGEVIRENIDIANATTYKLEFFVPENTSTQDYMYNLSK